MTETSKPHGGIEKAGIGVLCVAVAALYALAAFAPAAPRLPARQGADVTPVALVMPGGDGGVGYSAQLLHDAFDRIGYRLAAVSADGEPVPRILLAKMPRDLGEFGTVDMRKRIFLRIMLPLVLEVNGAILRERKKLLDLKARAERGDLGAADRDWLDRLADNYGLADPDIAVLLDRVDIVPVSLALAQAAEESGWGTSRFTREGNALFGQWTFSGNGLVPRRAEDAPYRVRAFSTLAEAVRAYSHNLNTHRAYAEFRRKRAAMRAADAPLDGYALAGTLRQYSERREEYVRSLRSIIVANDLQALDMARLAGQDAGYGTKY